ncbi:hypothetical protein R7V75_03840 [Mesomycoplasma ovipneumoniae]|uniref:Uncharacterized protein n=1 Tax=Mesomycoplasma ovipneumoniae TaxID=29562 RepID=A0AAJ2P7Q0_9BACT|nr:hypothetical protein [Mesomycoplasma ovipneumoniae]MDW2834843.1 hypothetical protein [Mesomycoplasma ovipneumoniae]MDW2835934.1 hypothetical protein [Mesomycoplasma ovipneumoniae]MDW2852648.1 hypothetical protein [Mesomycoplasma ovipneumoniae]MDW2861343.1 hypothetical protein [Mesomycoplasma ovipneumoniae]MDW2861476.1 hypothetical protein [Mesomycoplasma ovipneumoniae]
MSKIGRFISTVLAVIIGNILLFAIIIATLYFLFKKQIESFEIDKIKASFEEFQKTFSKLDSAQIKKFQEGFDKLANLDLDSLKTQVEALKDMPEKLQKALKSVEELSKALQTIKATQGTSTTGAVVSQAVMDLGSSPSLFNFLNVAPFIKI